MFSSHEENYIIKIVRSTADTIYITHTLWLILSSGQLICTVKTVILLRCIIDDRHECIVLRYFTFFAIQLERITNHLDKKMTIGYYKKDGNKLKNEMILALQVLLHFPCMHCTADAFNSHQQQKFT